MPLLAALADLHLKGPIVRGLLRRGMDVIRGQDRGLCAKDDEPLLLMATTEGRIVLTNDVDFLVLDAAWQAAGRSHAGIVYWHQKKYPIGEAIHRIWVYASQTTPAGAANVLHYL